MEAFSEGCEKYKCHYKKIVMRVEPNGEVIDCLNRESLFNVKGIDLLKAIGSKRYIRFIQGAEDCNLCKDAGVMDLSFLWEMRPRTVLSYAKRLFLN
jgi:hypothetical protein